MEPLMPSEVARLVYGYLKKEKNDETAECFLKSSPHLTECYQMYKANRSFNIKFNGFDLHGIFDLFGTMCSMINNGVSEKCESKTLIEKLQYLLDKNQMPIQEDKCIETELNMVDKCVGSVVSTEDKSICTSINIEENRSTTEVLEIPSFSEMISCSGTKIKETDTINYETNVPVEKSPIIFSSPCLSSRLQLLNTNANSSNFSKVEDTSIESPKFQLNKQISSTPSKKFGETNNYAQPSFQNNEHNVHNQFSIGQSECLQIPEATSLESMPGLSKDDRSKDNSVVIDTGELVDTFLNDKSLLEKIADTINKSIEGQKETNSIQQGYILDPPTLEKALDSTQADPQIKNVLDEFLVFNVDNSNNIKKTDFSVVNHQESIKSRLRSAKKKDDNLNKSKRNNVNNQKHNYYGNEDSKVDSNIILIHDDNMKTTIYENYDLLSNQFILQSNDSNVGQSYNIETVEPEIEEDYFGKSNYVRIAPKKTPILKTHSAFENNIFPKRRRRNFEELRVKSQFKKTNIIIQPPLPLVQSSSQSFVIEVPNQSSFETQTKNTLGSTTNILPEVSKIPSGIKNVDEEKTTHDTPDDRLIPPKNKSMSTPRRRSTHIRCLDFSTPQPKNCARDQARSKLFCDTPKRIEKIVEEPTPSPLPKLQADWGSVNGFESIVKKDTTKHWDTHIREMVGAGILTSDADGKKTRKKKTPRKKIKLVSDKKNSALVSDELNKSNSSIDDNELQTNKSNVSENLCDSNEPHFTKPLLNDPNSLEEDLITIPISLETPDKHVELLNEPFLTELSSLKNLNDSKSIKVLDSLESPVKTLELCREQLSTKSNSLTSTNDKELPNKPSLFSIPLETPIKITKLSNEQPSDKSLKNISNDNKLSTKNNEFSTSLETPIKTTEICNKQSIEFNSLNILCKTLNKPEGSENSLNEQKNNLNQLNTNTNKSSEPSSSIKLPEINKKQEKDSKFLETFNNHQCLKSLSVNKQPENKTVHLNENLKKQSSTDQIETKKLGELNSPEIMQMQPVKHNLIETPFKCDDSAVDVPETPISKLLREYDPSKLVTPLPSTPVHYEDSLTETPLTKVFRETSYLNRPPISPFPPTPGNSMSVDTLITPPDQECSKSLTNVGSRIKELATQTILPTVNTETSATKKKMQPTPLKPKTKVSKKVINSGNKKKTTMTAKKKQVYESVKVDLFGSEMSTSLSTDESDNINLNKTSIILSKKLQEKKTTGFKPIPKRKSVQSSSVLFNGVDNCILNSSNTNLNKSTIKPTVLQNNKSFSKNTKNISNATQTKKYKKSMVHFDDPVKEICYLPTNHTHNESNKKIGKLQEKTITDQKSNHLGLNKYENKPTTFYECKEVNTLKPKDTAPQLNHSNPSINYNFDKSDSKITIISPNTSINISKNTQENNLSQVGFINKSKINIKKDKFDKKIPLTSTNLNNKTKNQKLSIKKRSSTDNCVLRVNQNFDNKEEILRENKSNLSLHTVHSTSIKSNDAKDSSQNVSSNNSLNNSSHKKLNLLELNSISYSGSESNTACCTVENENKLFQLMKDDNTLNNIEYLKKPKVYEVITEDGEHEMLHLTLSDTFTFLDIPSELNNVQLSNSITPPLITKELLDVTSKIEAGELGEIYDDDITMPATSTPKDVFEKKIDERQNRMRRSPSFWDDSVHNYPVKQRYDRHRDSSNCWRNKRDSRYDKNEKYRSNKSRYYKEAVQSNSWNRFQHKYTKQDARDDSSRFKHKEEFRRSYRGYTNYDERKGRDRLEESERFSSGQRMLEKVNKTEDIVKKATKRPADRADYNKTPAKVSKVEHQRLLKNVDVDDFLSVVHGRK